MIKKILSILTLVVLTLGYFSCSEESNPVFDQNNFTKIFDDNAFSAAYYPIDIQQTEDGGYLILAGIELENSDYFGTYILKANKEGDFEKELYLDENLVGPVGKLMKIGDTYTFFCMDEVNNLEVQIVTIDGSAENLTTTPVSGLTYPAVAAIDGANYILLSYDNTNNESVISIVNNSGGLLKSKGFGIGAGGEEGVEGPILNHYIRTGNKFPFQVGRTGSVYYFNGFYNYTFSLVFTDLNADDPQGVVQGQQDDGGMSAIVPISGSTFAAARFNFDANYTLPNVTLSLNGNSFSSDLGGNSFPELEANAAIKILRGNNGTTNFLAFGSSTRSKQIGIYYYNENGGTFISSQYLGFSNPFEIAGLSQTADGGLIICGTTYLAGRFPRICLFKISKDELQKQL